MATKTVSKNITQLGIIGNYGRNDQTYASLFMAYSASKKQRHRINCHYGTTQANDVSNLAFRWDNQVYPLSSCSVPEIQGWSSRFDTCFWYTPDDRLFDIIKEFNVKCKHAYFVDYYKWSREQYKFNLKMDYTVCPSEKVKELYIGVKDERNLLVMPPDMLFMPMLGSKRKRITHPVSDKIIVTEVNSTVKLNSNEINILFSLMDHIDDLRLIIIFNDKVNNYSNAIKKLKTKYGNRLSVMIEPSDFSLIQLSEKKLYYFIDFNRTASYGSIVALFRNAGIPTMCYNTPVHCDAHVDGFTGYSLPCDVVTKGMLDYCIPCDAELLYYLYKILSNPGYYEKVINNLDMYDKRANVRGMINNVIYTLLPSPGDITKQEEARRREGSELEDLLVL